MATGSADIQELVNWRIIAFTAAGFGSMPNHFSVESNFLVIGRVLKRDGVVLCHGGLLGHRCAKIHRVCKSSLSDEAHATITALDWSLWFHVLLIELFANHFDIRQICPPTSFPMRNPFGESPTDDEVCGEVKKMHRQTIEKAMNIRLRGKSKYHLQQVEETLLAASEAK